MRNLRKVSKIAKLSFLNALRLHKDSIFLYKIGSYPSSYQLSIIAQEEIGKSFIMQNHIFQMQGRVDQIEPALESIVITAMLSHKIKQGSFSRQADDFWKYGGRKYPKIINDISSGYLDQKKQNSTYVGLTKKYGKTDPKGKVIYPNKYIRQKDVYSMITRVNDFIIVLVEGVRRGINYVDSDDLDDALSIKIVRELETVWPYKALSTIKKLKDIRKYGIDNTN
jgi:AbiV family abortive infection protein